MAELEYARHKAWRVAGQMQHIIDSLPFGTDAKVLAQILESAAQELIDAKELLLDEKSDVVGFLVQKGDTVEVGRDRNVAKGYEVIKGKEALTRSRL